MLNRKNFLQYGALSAAGLSLLEFMEPAKAAEMKAQLERVAPLSPEESAKDEDFWNWVGEQYTVSPNITNMNNGGVSPQPKEVQDAHIANYQMCNQGPSYFMWRILDQGREPLRSKLADLAGCSPEEIAINRNSTEGLNNVILGINLKAGDEVVISNFDYPHMEQAWKQREKRDGIKINTVKLDLPIESDSTFLDLYEKAITPKTKVVLITHIINWTGQIVPVRKIADMAHKKGCEVIVDGAHSFALLDFKIPDLDCDYFATSLHKWLCAPFGSGMMYVKKEKIKNIWPLLTSSDPLSEDIRKFEELGTRSMASEMAIGNAVDFHNLIGAKRKEERLRYLKDRWCNAVRKNPKIKLYTSLKPEYSCVVANFGIDGWKPEDIDSKLFEKWKIHVTTINHENVHGVRVSPNVYTSLKDIDRLIEAINAIAEMEPPKK